MSVISRVLGLPRGGMSVNMLWPDKLTITPDAEVINDIKSKGSPLPKSRQSLPDHEGTSPANLATQYNEYGILKPAWFLDLIPILRRLSETNDDIGQALHNVVTLANTGHRIAFDSNVSPEDSTKMREHLKEKFKEWGMGVVGPEGFVNRMFAQIILGGALSTEWVVNNSLTGVESVPFVKPETIRFKLNSRGTGYLPFQKVKTLLNNGSLPQDLIPLNPETYRYFAYGGDGENPYGIPPYLNALEGLSTQKSMKQNIDFIVNQLGIMGFASLYIDKPEMEDNESEEEYYARLETRLGDAQVRMQGGIRDGIVVAYKDDQQIDFNSTSQNFEGVTKAFEQNEVQIASGLKMDPSLMGRGYGSSETQITIVFTKLLSEMHYIQDMVKTNLEFGCALELRLAGFNFKTLEVKFNRSTLQDELKHQQGREINIRNLHQLRIDGVINQNQYAEEAGYDAPAQMEPEVPFDQQDGKPATDPESKDKREKGKDASDRKVRDKNKPQGTTKK